MSPEDNPADEVQMTEEEWEEYVERNSVECPACSEAGGADRAVKHLPPVCKAVDAAKGIRVG